nr:MAG TPA: hypothetical protein [Caudoviricetes sp.]
MAVSVPFWIVASLSAALRLFSNALTESIRFFKALTCGVFFFSAFFGAVFLLSGLAAGFDGVGRFGSGFLSGSLGLEGCGGTTKSCFGGSGASSGTGSG